MITAHSYYLYKSRLAKVLTGDALANISIAARQNNRTAMITGCMILQDGYFYQFFEGPTPACEALLARLEQDPRHDKLRIVAAGLSYERAFSRWSTGFTGVSQTQYPPVGGCSTHLGRHLRHANAEALLAHLQEVASYPWVPTNLDEISESAPVQMSRPPAQAEEAQQLHA